MEIHIFRGLIVYSEGPTGRDTRENKILHIFKKQNLLLAAQFVLYSDQTFTPIQKTFYYSSGLTSCLPLSMCDGPLEETFLSLRKCSALLSNVNKTIFFNASVFMCYDSSRAAQWTICNTSFCYVRL